MGEAIHVARTKDEATPKLEWTFKLEWIFAEFVVAVPGGLGPPARRGVVGAEQVEEICLAKSGGLVHPAVFVEEQREGDPGLLVDLAGVISAAEPDRSNVRSLLPEYFFSVAQLRDMLTAEDSTPVAQKNDDRGLVRPERAELDGPAIDVGQSDGREGSGERHRISFRLPVTGFKGESPFHDRPGGLTDPSPVRRRVGQPAGLENRRQNEGILLNELATTCQCLPRLTQTSTYLPLALLSLPPEVATCE